jgi:hypothetical protein
MIRWKLLRPSERCCNAQAAQLPHVSQRQEAGDLSHARLHQLAIALKSTVRIRIINATLFLRAQIERVTFNGMSTRLSTQAAVEFAPQPQQAGYRWTELDEL